uniref:Uncharacterized protein n=1 Tax=Anguilla anguilla TaxID=7936 RepID=A0A0E9Q3Q8_ANGAN
MVLDYLSTCPALLQTSQTALLTERDPSLVVIHLPSQSGLALSALEAVSVICPVQASIAGSARATGFRQNPHTSLLPGPISSPWLG